MAISRGTDGRGAIGRVAPGTGEHPVAGADARGFSARVRGAALADLIQLECLSPAAKAVRVIGAGGGATLFFRDSRLVHAAVGRVTGESALAEVLAWGEGSCEPCDSPWPAVETITASLEHVLLRAAQAIDEARAGGRPPQLVAVPPGGAPAPARFSPPGRKDLDLELWVQLTAAGDILEHEGAGSEEFADAIAYATQLADLVGALLGVARPLEIELGFERGRCLVHRQGDGAVLALKPGPETSIEELRAKLGAGA